MDTISEHKVAEVVIKLTVDLSEKDKTIENLMNICKRMETENKALRHNSKRKDATISFQARRLNDAMHGWGNRLQAYWEKKRDNVQLQAQLLVVKVKSDLRDILTKYKKYYTQ